MKIKIVSVFILMFVFMTGTAVCENGCGTPVECYENSLQNLQQARKEIENLVNEVEKLKKVIDEIRAVSNKNIYTGFIAPTEWASRVIKGQIKGWKKFWEGSIDVPSDAVGEDGKALMAVALMGFGLGQHCFFNIFIDDKPIAGSGLGGSLIYPSSGQVNNFWMNAAYANFAVVSSGHHKLSVVVSNSYEQQNYICALNGARLNYAIIPASRVIQNKPIKVNQID